MSGLEKIIERIEADAKYAYDQLITQTEEEIKILLGKEKQEEEKQRLVWMEQIDSKVAGKISRAKSRVALQERKMLLQTKQDLIKNIMDEANESLLSLSDEEYMERISMMLKVHARKVGDEWRAGEIIFSSSDKERLTDAIKEECKQYSLAISSSVENISGGFILRYGEVEENCSFEALFMAAKEDLQDDINHILFKSSKDLEIDTVN